MLPPPAPVVVVHADYGGKIDDYAKRVLAYKGRRVRVRLDGECDSACTMVAALDARLCVSPDSIMGFHQAYLPNPFDPLDTSMRVEDGTALLMRMYPQRLRDWIASKGGLTKDLLVLRGRARAVVPDVPMTNWAEAQSQFRLETASTRSAGQQAVA